MLQRAPSLSDRVAPLAMLRAMSVRFSLDGPLAAGSLRWQVQGRDAWATIVLKLRCELASNGALELADAPEITSTDRHLRDDPAGPLIDASDLVPRLAHGEVYVARAPELPPAQAPRGIAVMRDGQRIVAKVAGPAQGLAFGPIAASWPARAKLVQPGQLNIAPGPVFMLTESLRWDYFQAAPSDQRITGPFRGDEVIELSGFSEPGLVALALPALQLEVRVRRGAEDEIPCAPSLDTVRVEPSGRSLVLTFRETFPARPDEVLTVRASVARAVVVKEVSGALLSATATAPVDPRAVDAPIAPFLQRMKSTAASDRSDLSATPWAKPEVPPGPAGSSGAAGVGPAPAVAALAPPPLVAPIAPALGVERAPVAPSAPAAKPPAEIELVDIAPRAAVVAKPDPLAPPNLAAEFARPAQSNSDLARMLALAGASPEVIVDA